MDDIQEQLKELRKRIQKLEDKRILQQDIVPDVVKMRHMGEGIRFIRGGSASNKPTSGEEPLQGNAVYFDETNNKLWIWDRTSDSWLSVTLS